MILNFTNVPDYVERNFVPLPDGEYKTMLFSIELSQSKNNDDMVICGFKILNDPTDFKDRIVKEYYVLNNELGLSKFKKLLQLSEIELTKDINLDTLIADGDLLGKKYNMQIVTNEYVNKYSQKVLGNRIKNFVE